jgi:hypothetical protein
MENKYKINFEEFKILVSVTIPQRPIARTMFFHNVIDKYYYEMTSEERERLFEWINRDYGFKDSLENNNEDCLTFNARFDKDNQYLVSTFFAGKEDKIETFKVGERYYTSRNTSINEEYITNIEKL